MDRKTAKQQILQGVSCTKFLEKSGSNMYVCPFCGSGTGKNRTGALKVYDTNTFTCFACNHSGDVIDLYKQVYGVDYSTALHNLAGEIGITIDKNMAYNRTPHTNIVKKPVNKKVAKTDYTNYYKECKKRLESPEAVAYLKGRCISLETAKAYNIGFDPQADPVQKGFKTPRLIIPTSKYHYVARAIDKDAKIKVLNPKDSKPDIFNKEVLFSEGVEEVFVTEGIFDALSVIEVGYDAIALNSTSNVTKLVKELEKNKTKATLVLALDNDKAGERATDKLVAELKRLNISHIKANISGYHKDPNDALCSSLNEFINGLYNARNLATSKPDNTSLYIEYFMNNEIEKLKDEVKTGFDNLDEKSGGLYSGLYVIAAISSLGKTSFSLQLADQLANKGKDVLFFSLEQSKLELVSKSIARKTAQIDMKEAVSSLAIRKGKKAPIIDRAVKEYCQEVNDHISIIEGNFNCDITFISNYIRNYSEKNNSKPIVFIDYLQILQPDENNKRLNLKDNIDNMVTELKRLCRELDITIFVISSVNRSNYLTPIDFESLKESGSIEYTADVIWGLQLQCLKEDIFAKESKIKEKRELIREAKVKNPREIELVCLKNRYGIANYSCYFNYYPANDLFKEDVKPEYYKDIEWKADKTY